MRALAPALLLTFAFAAPPAGAQTPIATYVYERCAAVGEASVVEIVGAPCAEAEALAGQLVATAPDGAGAVLAAAGWTALRARASNTAGTQHDLVALRGGASLRIRRAGAVPDLDGWQAGRELIFARPRLVAGGRVPSGAAVCTSSFLVRFPNGSFGGLSAAHCGGLRSDRTVHRRHVALRRPPQQGIVLGRVQRILTRTLPYDALVVPVPSGANRPRVAVVDRGVSRPPWRIAGPAQSTAGRAVCYSGRTSGIDQCGTIAGRSVRRAERLLSVFAGVVVRCTTMRAREGDSGGPVYTAPRADGTVRAVGIVTLVVGSAARMCFTPLGPVLDGLNAELVAASG